MQSYKRKITYFYQHHNGNIGATAGFLKLEIRGDKVKIIINIQEPVGASSKEASLYFYHEAGDHLAAVRVDQVNRVNGALTYQNRTDWNSMFDTGRDLYTFDGVAVVYDDSHYYIGDFQDKNRQGYELVRNETTQNADTKKEAVKGQEEKDNATKGNIYRPAMLRKKEKPTEEFVKVFREPEEIPKDNMSQKPIEENTKIQQAESAKEHSGENQRSAMEEPQQETETVWKPEEKKTQEPQLEALSGWNDLLAETFEKKEGEFSQNQRVSEKTFRRLDEKMECPGEKTSRTMDEKVECPEEKTSRTMDEKMECSKEKAEEKKVSEKCKNCPYHQKRAEQQEHKDAFDKMLSEYPKLPMYSATELFDCVRIQPRDIGKLDMRNWKLGVNSFLTHGFYTYQYLLLGKMRFDNGMERPIIGVPGVYSNREKYLANMFGFEQFIPIKRTGVKTGEFGYWIVEISPYL